LPIYDSSMLRHKSRGVRLPGHRMALESIFQNETASLELSKASDATRSRMAIASQVRFMKYRKCVIKWEIAEPEAREAMISRMAAKTWVRERAKARACAERKKQRLAKEKARKEALRKAITQTRDDRLSWDDLSTQFLELTLR
jgi:hypothetical protein